MSRLGCASSVARKNPENIEDESYIISSVIYHTLHSREGINVNISCVDYPEPSVIKRDQQLSIYKTCLRCTPCSYYQCLGISLCWQVFHSQFPPS